MNTKKVYLSVPLWNKISYLGIREGLSVTDERTTVVVNRISAIFAIFVATSIIINLILGSFFFIPVLSIALVSLGLIYLFNYYGRYLAAKVTLMLLALLVLFYMCVKAGLGSGLEFYFISLTPLPVLIFRDKKTIVAFQLLCILFLIGQKAYVDIVRPEDPSRAIEYQVFYIVNSIYSCILIIVSIFFFSKLIHKRENELEESYQIISSKNSMLETANKELDTFTYSVSHDLRGPLRAIDGFSSLMQRKKSVQDDSEASEYLSLIQHNTRQMRLLIEDLLKLSHISKYDIVKKEVDMNALVQAVLQDFEEEVRRTSVKVKLKLLPKGTADPVLLKQVWLNLVSNAIKYSAKTEAPLIEIGSRQQRGRLEYFVKDNGIGFDMQYAGKLFEPFNRLHKGEEYSGTGVGLAIVNNIIRAHGGQVWAESEPGKGSTFYFTLP